MCTVFLLVVVRCVVYTTKNIVEHKFLGAYKEDVQICFSGRIIGEGFFINGASNLFHRSKKLYNTLLWNFRQWSDISMSGIRLSFSVLILCLLLVMTSLHRAVSQSINGKQDGSYFYSVLFFIIILKQGKCNKKQCVLYIGDERIKND